LTEASTTKQASLHLVVGKAALDPGGLEMLMDLEGFRTALTKESHTLKRAPTWTLDELEARKRG
jgi:hypothetical protein